MGLREAIQPVFQMVWGTVEKNVEAMPDGVMEFRPEGLETRSFREIAVHMANACVTFGENIGKTRWERIAAYPPEKVVTRAQVLDALRDAGGRFLSGLARLTDEEAARTVQTPWGAEMTQGQIMTGHVSHMFYHNGQLTIYLRLQGIKPAFLSR